MITESLVSAALDRLKFPKFTLSAVNITWNTLWSHAGAGAFTPNYINFETHSKTTTEPAQHYFLDFNMDVQTASIAGTHPQVKIDLMVDHGYGAGLKTFSPLIYFSASNQFDIQKLNHRYLGLIHSFKLSMTGQDATTNIDLYVTYQATGWKIQV